MTRVGNGGARRAAMAALIGVAAAAAISLGSGSVASAQGTPTNSGQTQPGGSTSSGGSSVSGGSGQEGGTGTSGGSSQPGSGGTPANANDELSCTPIDTTTESGAQMLGEKARVVIIAGSDPADRELAKTIAGASSGSLEIVESYALGEKAPKGFVPLDLSEGSASRQQLVETPGPYIALVVGDEKGEVDPVLVDELSAFVYSTSELGVDAANPMGSIASKYVERASGRPAADRLTVAAEDAAIAPRWDQGTLIVDLAGRAGRTTIDVSGLTLGGEPLCGGASVLPFRVVTSGSQGPAGLTGKELAGQVDGLDLAQAAIPSTADLGGGTTAPSSTPATTAPKDSGDGAADDGGGGSSLLPVLLVAVFVLGVAGLVAYVLIARRRDDPATTGWTGGPTGPVTPASPHGPSPIAGQPAAAPPVAVMAPVAAAAVPTGRAVTPPAFVPLDFGDPAPGWTAAVPGDGSVRISDLGLMRVQPMETAHGRTWSSQSSVAVGAAGWLEKKAGRGEDAEPTVRLHEARRGLVGVYDGTGGAGSAPARRLRDGTEQTGAFVASRLARDLVESWYAGVVERGAVASDAEGLRDFLAAAFRDEAEFSLESSAGLKGSLSRVLPTTMALAAFGTLERDGRQLTLVDALWAGDSRTYLLTPGAGLQVLSVDDTRETDALALIRNDQPMDNLVSADRPFRVNHRQVTLDSPGVILTATDGCFGYVKTPAHFEHLVLTSLQASTTLEGWAGEVIEVLSSFTADDASFALAAVGFPSFASLRSAFAERGAFVAEHHWVPFDGLTDDGAIDQRREQSWAGYRDLYHARLQDPPPS